MSMVVTVKQTVENGGKIKPSLNDLCVHLSHNGLWLLGTTFFFTEHLVRQQLNTAADFPFSVWQQFRAECGKKIKCQLIVTTYEVLHFKIA